MALTITRPRRGGRDDNALMSSSTVEQLDLADESTAVQVLAIQRDAYQMEAELIGFDGIPPLLETIDELVAQPLSWLGIRSREGAVVAALGFARTEESVDIDRLMVAPDHHRRGMARALLAALGDEARITVSTGTANAPAHRLYESNGFNNIGTEMIEPGLSITRFMREPQQ